MKITDKIEITNEDNMLLMARYPDNYFDLAIVDPPYGIGAFKNGLGGTRFDKHKNGNLSFNNLKPTEEYFAELFRVSKNQIVWGANNFVMPPSEYFCIWNKKQTVDNFATAEYAWVSMGLKSPAKMFDYGIHKHNASEDKIHATQKPIPLYKWLLDKYAKENDKILDTHLGSGSIAIACHDYGYELTACELDKEYYDKAIQRITNHTNQQKLF
jgi:site-specific DNA-methyltransferase (adenine-specific)